MPRPHRVSYPGAIYVAWITGVNGTAIYRDDYDRRRFRRLLGAASLRFGWRVHRVRTDRSGYALIVETPRGNISRGMQWFNGVYAQGFNRRHGRTGHLFGDRFKSVLIRSLEQLRQLKIALGRSAPPRRTSLSSKRGTGVAAALALLAAAAYRRRPRAP